MTISKIYEVRDADGRLRFSTIYYADCAFYLKKLLQRLRPGQEKPVMIEVPCI